MSTDIFYFSGTGNSLHVAKKLGMLLPGPTRRTPVKDYSGREEAVTLADTVILVFPVYFLSIPAIFASFIEKLEFKSRNPHIYGVATCNGVPGHSLFTLNRKLAGKGKMLTAGFAIPMPGNSVILRDFTNPPEIRRKRLEDSERKLNEIAVYIGENRSGNMDGNRRLKTYFQGLVTRTVAKRIYRTPTKFRTSDRCSRCGICAGICPGNNIRMTEGGPKWGKHCEHCLACFHWCPNMAVELGRSTPGKLRYHHPDISANEMINGR